MADATRIHASRSNIVNGLLQGSAWEGPLTYAVCNAAPSDEDYAPQQVDAPSRAFSDAVRAVFAQVAGVVATDVEPGRGEDAAVNLYVADSLAFRTSHGVARLPLGGYSFFPAAGGQGGDVWIGTDVAHDLDPGGYGFRTLMHEVGHALGLKHPHERGGFGTLAASLDGEEHSVMSARSVPGTDVSHGLSNEPDGFAETFMPYDIAALQHLYGADYSDRGNDRYRFDPLERVISKTIWDGGGTDTYDFSLYAFAVDIDLTPGGASKTGQEAHINRDDPSADPIYADGSIHNAYLVGTNWRSAIENARGGWGDDMIRGNRVSNDLKGGVGDDTLVGDRLFDTLDGGVGDDGLAGGTGADTLLGGWGNDKLVGQQGSDALFGGSGVDLLLGSQGDDLIDGGSDADRLAGGLGDDTLTGGRGADVFMLDLGADTVLDFVHGLDHIAAGDAAAAFGSLHDSAHGAVVSFGGATMTLAGIHADALTLADFF